MSASTSALNSLALYGRKWQLDIKFPTQTNGQQTVLTLKDDFSSDALRITFSVYMATWRAAWYADIDIYNMDSAATDQLLGAGNPTDLSGIKEGMEVVLQTGYQNGSPGIIWDGFVFQPLFDRLDVVDFKITLHCVIWLADWARNSINRVYGAGTTQQQLVRQMAKDCFKPINVNTMSSAVSNEALIRGKSVFGNPDYYFQRIATASNAQTWLSAKGLNMASFKAESDLSKNVDITYTPTTGLIGVPQQTEYGANFRVLLDPRLEAKKPYQKVKINQSIIRQQKRQVGNLPGQNGLGLLDQDGEYFVASVRHFGDSRGPDWYTDVVGVSQAVGAAGLLLPVGASATQGDPW